MKRNLLKANVALLLVVAPALVAGCRSIEEMAPPVDERMLVSEPPPFGSASQLSRGRKIYLKQCISCHTVQPVDGWTIAEWEKIVPEMSEDSKLDAAQQEDLWAYIRTAHAHLKANRNNR